MNDDSLLTLIWNASLPVQLVMLILLVASVMSWALMYVKRGYIRQSQAEAKEFEGRFWSGANLSELFGQLSHKSCYFAVEIRAIGLCDRLNSRCFDPMRIHRSPIFVHPEAEMRSRCESCTADVADPLAL